MLCGYYYSRYFHTKWIGFDSGWENCAQLSFHIHIWIAVLISFLSFCVYWRRCYRSKSIAVILSGRCTSGPGINVLWRVIRIPVQQLIHDEVIKWKRFPRYWLFVRGIHRSPVNSPHKGQWRGSLMFSSIWAWKNGWINNCEAGDLRRYHAHYDVIVIWVSVRTKQALINPSICRTNDPKCDVNKHIFCLTFPVYEF